MNRLCKVMLIFVLVLTLSACHNNINNNQEITSDKKDETVERTPLKYVKMHLVDDQIYTGKEIKPSLDLKDKGKTLFEGVDYTIDYENNINVGTAKMTVTGIGNYDGIVVIRFKIVENNNN